MPRRRLTPGPPFAAVLAGALTATLLTALPAGADPLDVLDPPGDGAQGQPTERVDKTFKVGTLNILGSQHTAGGDRKRSKRTARLLRDRNLAVVGLQEVQDDQLRVLRKKMPRYRIWPGEEYGPGGIRLQAAWKKRRFDLRDHGSITTTFSHQRRPVPWVRLRDEQTGRAFSVVVVHNSPEDQEADRDSATRKEIRLYRQLRERGPVLVVGDTNERGEWFCKVTRATDAKAANGGRHRDRCEPPSPTYVDWLMGGGRFDWRHYEAREVKVSDHLLHTSVLRWGRG